jgi:4-hydroxybenzoate polyprenyltransferase
MGIQRLPVGFSSKENAIMAILWAILAIILAIWLIGLLADIAGGLIHLLLIVALAVLIYNLITSRRAA